MENLNLNHILFIIVLLIMLFSVTMLALFCKANIVTSNTSVVSVMEKSVENN
jgi:hypothetical protein